MRLNEDQGILYLTPEEAVILYKVLFTKQADGTPASWIEWSDIGSSTKELVKNVFAWKARKSTKAELPIYQSVFQRSASEITRYKARKYAYGCHVLYLYHTLVWIDDDSGRRSDPPEWPCEDFPRVVS